MELISIESLLILIVLPFTTLLGVILKSAWDRFSIYKIKRKEETRTKKLSYLENKINNFYLPLYVHLQRDKYLWELVKQVICKKYEIIACDEDPCNDDAFVEKFKTILCNGDDNLLNQIEKSILSNHLKCLQIIDKNSILAEPVQYLIELLSQYAKHVVIYDYLRQDGIYEFPKNYGARYPSYLLKVVETKLFELENQYNTMLET